MRLGAGRPEAYWGFGLPMDEFQAVEAHLHECSECAGEYARVATECAEVENRRAEQLGLVTAHVLAERIMTAHESRQKERQPSYPWFRFLPIRPLPVAAVVGIALLLLAGGTVLGYTTYRALDKDAARQAQDFTPAPAANKPVVLSKARAEGQGGTPADGHSGQSIVADAAEGSDGLLKSIGQLTQEAAIRAQVEAMLPHTEEEYEAWARREYPHILWLYDVLMGKIPKKPAVSPAGRMVRFGVDKDGNPTITLPGADGHPETFTFPIPLGHTPGQSYWDGIPVNIPEWAQKLYANTPESQRSTGWRALLIYSGELFKFDWPINLSEANCVPSLPATQKAAQVGGGLAASTKDGVLNLARMSLSDVREQTLARQETLGSYIDALAKDTP